MSFFLVSDYSTMSDGRVNDNELLPCVGLVRCLMVGSMTMSFFLVLDHSTMSGRRANDNELLHCVGPQYNV